MTHKKSLAEKVIIFGKHPMPVSISTCSLKRIITIRACYLWSTENHNDPNFISMTSEADVPMVLE